MSPVVDFYRGSSVETVWADTDDRLERRHDYIQWLFPLPEPSRFSVTAPILTQADVAVFRGDVTLQDRVRRSLARMTLFFSRTRAWRRPHDHNHLRITRIIRCLTLLGMAPDAAGFLDWVLSEYPDAPASTRAYWSGALQEHPPWLSDRPSSEVMQ